VHTIQSIFSEVESRRFERKVVRFTVDSIDREVTSLLWNARPDLAIIRVPSGAIDQVHRLAMAGTAPIVADTLVHYGCDLATATPRPLKNGNLVFRRADASQTEEMRALVELIFKDYKNHYVSNPTLDRAAILAGYAEWGLSFLRTDGRLAWIAYEGDRIAAFANCASEGDVFEGVLYGVHPDFGGRGLYGDLIAYTQAYAKEQGFRKMDVSTQIDNLAVQKAWVRAGFFLERPLNTIHLNLFLSDEYALDQHGEKITLSADLVEQFGAVSGDRNPVHFEDEAARAAGFTGRIAHGAILNALVSRVLGQNVPGPGTIYLHQTGSYLKPAIVGDEIEVRLLVKHADPASGRLIASTRVYNSDGVMLFCGQAGILNPSYVARMRNPA
jgi:acyl dehydratase/ribosomal protein S18 acetylase RimI-like enzyme